MDEDRSRCSESTMDEELKNSDATVETEYKSSSRLGTCEVCLKALAKYTCPACELKTCSLDCVQGHKEAIGCSGVRNRVKFKPLVNFSDGDLQRDYILLEELSRSAEYFSKARRKSQKNLRLKWYKVRNAAFKKGINLQILPPSFAKRRANTTFYNWSSNIISWRVEWELGSGFRIVSEKVLETCLIRDLVKEILDNLGKLARKSLPHLFTEQIAVLMPAERVKGARFFKLDLDASLGEALLNKIVIEFPVLHITSESKLNEYDLLESDEGFANEVRKNGFSIYQPNCMQFFSDNIVGSDDSS